MDNVISTLNTLLETTKDGEHSKPGPPPSKKVFWFR